MGKRIKFVFNVSVTVPTSEDDITKDVIVQAEKDAREILFPIASAAHIVCLDWEVLREVRVENKK